MKGRDQITTIEELRALVPVSPAQAKSLDDRLFDYVDEFAAAFIADSPMVFIGTTTGAGHVDVSPKGDAPGFVVVDDPKTLLLPDRVGNTDMRGFRNILQNNAISLLFIIPRVPEVLRVTGHASISRNAALLERLGALGKPAQLCLRITVKECFFHCGRAMHRSQIWKPEKWPNDIKKYSFGQKAKQRNMDINELEQLSQNLRKQTGETKDTY